MLTTAQEVFVRNMLEKMEIYVHMNTHEEKHVATIRRQLLGKYTRDERDDAVAEARRIWWKKD